MRKLIRHRLADTFLTKEGHWANNPDAGRVIRSQQEIQGILEKCGLSPDEVELYYSFTEETNGSRSLDFSLPLGGRIEPKRRRQTFSPV